MPWHRDLCNRATKPGSTSSSHRYSIIADAKQSSSLYPNLFAAVPNQIVALFLLLESPVTFEVAMEMIRWNNPDLLLAPAHVLDGVASDEKYLEEVSSKVSMISFGGGPLSKPTGDILTRYFRVSGMYGTSEMDIVHKLVPCGSWDPRGWNSWKTHPNNNSSSDSCLEIWSNCDAERERRGRTICLQIVSFPARMVYKEYVFSRSSSRRLLDLPGPGRRSPYTEKWRHRKSIGI